MYTWKLPEHQCTYANETPLSDFSLQYLMQCYLKIQQTARKYQAEREHLQSGEHEASPSHTTTDKTATTVSPPKYSLPTIHFVETASSVLRELPWILPKEHKVHIVFMCIHLRLRESANFP